MHEKNTLKGVNYLILIDLSAFDSLGVAVYSDTKGTEAHSFVCIFVTILKEIAIFISGVSD